MLYISIYNLFLASSAFLRSLSLLLGCIAGTSVVGDLLITGDVRAAGGDGETGEVRAAGGDGETLVATVDTNGDFFLGRPFNLMMNYSYYFLL